MRLVWIALGFIAAFAAIVVLYFLLSGKPLPFSPAAPVQVAGGGEASATNQNPTTFSDPSGFSFAIPAGFHAERTIDDSGETVLVQSADASHGFQVYITQFSDPGSSITRERVVKEAGLTVANDKPLTVAGVAQGLAFDSTADAPPTRQAWFVYNGYLYQVSSLATDANVLDRVLASWEFSS